MSRIALVSCLPPELTGVAWFAHRLLVSAGEIWQAYATPAAGRSYLATNPSDDTRRSVRPLDQLERDAERDLDAVVVMLGNSEHFVPILEWASASRWRSERAPLLLYLHDAFLLNVLGLVASGNDLVAAMGRDHGREIRMPSSYDEIAEFVEQGVLGVGTIIRLMRPDLVLVNSASAKTIIEREPGRTGKVPVEIVFHPVFPASARWQCDAPPRSPRVGSFGVPTPFKQLEMVIEAHTLRRQTEPSATLVLAGYGMGRFAADRAPQPNAGLEVYDSPDDETLDSLMASVDLAVQLRAADLGESSGVIARLLAVGTPIITSPRGSALELGDAVAFARPPVNAPELLDLIRSELAQSGHRRASAQRFVEHHTPQDLVARIVQLARESAARSTVRRAT